MKKIPSALSALAVALVSVLSVASVADAAPRVVTLAFEGWHCEGCASSARIAIKKLDGIESIETSVEKGEAVVRYDDAKVTPEKMLAAVEKVGYRGSVRKAPQAVESPAAGEATRRAAVAATDRVLFFDVPLACPAVEGLGCGSLAGPVLAQLDESPGVAVARVNHAGMVLAVERKDGGGSDGAKLVAVVESVFQKNGLEAALLEGKPLADARGAYPSDRWYRANEIDGLNREESRVIAARLVSRVGKKVALDRERAAALENDLAAGFLKVFRGAEGCHDDLRALAAKHLDAEGLARFEEAVAAGLARRPEDAL